jgi:hypothetical protein
MELVPMLVRLMTEVIGLIKQTAQNPAETLKRLLRVAPLLILLAGFAAANTGRIAVVVSPSELEMLHQSRDAQAAVDQSKNEFFKYLLEDYRSKMLDNFGDMKKGSLFIDPNPIQRIALQMMRRYAKTRVIATSSAPDWWNDDFGRDYEKANLELRARGVSVTRIFLYNDEKEKTNLLEHLQSQKKAGIEVLLAPISKSMRAEDYIVIDDAYAGVLQLGIDRSPANVQFQFDPRRVNEVKALVEDIRRRAQSF